MKYWENREDEYYLKPEVIKQLENANYLESLQLALQSTDEQMENINKQYKNSSFCSASKNTCKSCLWFECFGKTCLAYADKLDWDFPTEFEAREWFNNVRPKFVESIEKKY